MLRLIFSRVLSGFLVVIAVATFSFFMLRAAPGGPFDAERNVPPSILRNIEKHYNLDKSLLEQYAIYMERLVLHLDLGHSVKRPQSVREIIADHFPNSVLLGLLALGFATLAGVLLGVVAAARQNT